MFGRTIYEGLRLLGFRILVLAQVTTDMTRHDEMSFWIGLFLKTCYIKYLIADTERNFSMKISESRTAI